MGKYDDQSEERSPSIAANPLGSGGPAADGRAEDFFSQGAVGSFSFLSNSHLILLQVLFFLIVIYFRQQTVPPKVSIMAPHTYHSTYHNVISRV